jgi:lipoprotein
MEKRMFAEKAPRDKVYRALAVFALLPSCFLAGCAGEKGVDAGSSSSAPYGGSETSTSQPENSNTENPSQNKKDDSAGKIDIEKNSMYYSENGTREGFVANCTAKTYDGFPEKADCSMYLCDGDNTVMFTFNNVDFTEQTYGKRKPGVSDLMSKTNTLAVDYRYYVPTETLKNTTECKEKKSNVGQFTKPVSFPRGENEQYLCLPQFMTTVDGKKMGMKITKTTSVDEKDNDGSYYPQYKLGTSEECFNWRALD